MRDGKEGRQLVERPGRREIDWAASARCGWCMEEEEKVGMGGTLVLAGRLVLSHGFPQNDEWEGRADVC